VIDGVELVFHAVLTSVAPSKSRWTVRLEPGRLCSLNVWSSGASSPVNVNELEVPAPVASGSSSSSS
jgi:hypothetical protein